MPALQATIRRTVAAITRSWGFSAFVAVSFYSFLRLLHSDTPGHYRIFTGAARALWNAQNPHGTDFGTGVGLWFYSPTCAMFFFAPFGWLPEKLGLALYVALSWLVFVIAVRVVSSAYVADLKERYPPEKLMNIFWLVISPQMMLGILASKIEVLMVGLILLSAYWISRKRWLAVSTGLLALMINWKFQPLPIAGLIFLIWLLAERRIGIIVSFFLWSFLWFALPLVYLKLGFLIGIYEAWATTLGAFVRDAFSNFDNAFALIQHGLGFKFSYRVSQIASLAVGVFMAAVTIVWVFWSRRLCVRQRVLDLGMRIALVLGSAFTTVLSPLNQNNGYILYAPMLLICLCAFASSWGLWRKAWRVVLAIAIAIMVLGYSDILPASVSLALRHAALKSAACLLLCVMMLTFAFSRQFLALSADKSLSH